jgi:hypothetical protein
MAEDPVVIPKLVNTVEQRFAWPGKRTEGKDETTVINSFIDYEARAAFWSGSRGGLKLGSEQLQTALPFV